jgi:hypothetical protein
MKIEEEQKLVAFDFESSKKGYFYLKYFSCDSLPKSSNVNVICWMGDVKR